MIQELFAVFDSATGAFNRVFQAPTIEVALRVFRSNVMEPDSAFNQFPDDYTLFHVGSFDLKTGELKPLKTPHSLGLAITFLPEGPSLQQDIFSEEVESA